MKRMPIAVLAMALMVALGGLGVVYGAGPWSQTLTAPVTVNSATWNVYWDVATVSPTDPASGVTCQVSGDETATLTVTVGNAYPNKGCAITASIVNGSSIPVSLGVPPVFSSGFDWISGISSLFLHGDLGVGESTGPHAYVVTVNENLGIQTSVATATGSFSITASQK